MCFALCIIGHSAFCIVYHIVRFNIWIVLLIMLWHFYHIVNVESRQRWCSNSRICWNCWCCWFVLVVSDEAISTVVVVTAIVASVVVVDQSSQICRWSFGRRSTLQSKSKCTAIEDEVHERRLAEASSERETEVVHPPIYYNSMVMSAHVD